MNICLLIDAWEPIWGGGQTHVWEICRRLVTKFDCKVTIYTRSLTSNDGTVWNDNEIFLNGKLRVIRIGKPTNFFELWSRIVWIFQAVRKVILDHRKKPFTIIHAHAYSAGIPAKILHLLIKVPVVFTVHGSNNLDLRPWSVIGIMERFLLTRIKYNAEISVSHNFLKYPNVNSVSVVPNGVRKYNLRKLRKHLKSKFTVLWVGRFDPVKGLDVLVRAFSRFSVQNKSVRLLLVGAGPEQAQIKNLVDNLSLRDRVQFLGELYGRDLAEIYYRANVFVLPSFSEGHPLTLFEAWAAQLPVIATSVGDIPIYVKHGINGLLVQPGDEVGLAQALEKVRGLTTNQLGRAGFKTCAQYTWDRAAERTYLILNKIVHNSIL